MVVKCPKCAREVQDDSVYCPHCGHGLKPSAITTQVSAGGTLIVVTAVASFIHFMLSLQALANIYRWYPPLVAQNWIIYDQMLTIFSFTGLLFGFSAGTLSLTRRKYKWTIVCAILSTISGGSAWITSIIIPFSNWGYSTYYFFLPLLIPALIGALLILPRRAEFKQ